MGRVGSPAFIATIARCVRRTSSSTVSFDAIAIPKPAITARFTPSGCMNVDVRDAGGALLVVSQFTLTGDCRKGRRPSWDAAARPEEGRAWYERALDAWRATGVEVQSGVFQADMQVALVNDGPVTLLLDSRKQF